jgi:hypothetical protein
MLLLEMPATSKSILSASTPASMLTYTSPSSFVYDQQASSKRTHAASVLLNQHVACTWQACRLVQYVGWRCDDRIKHKGATISSRFCIESEIPHHGMIVSAHSEADCHELLMLKPKLLADQSGIVAWPRRESDRLKLYERNHTNLPGLPC